jgi:RHS repeat-associated protein
MAAAKRLTPVTQGGSTTSYTRDAAGRSETATTTGNAARTLTRHYTNASDKPGWVVETFGPNTSTTRYASSIGGNVPIEIKNGSVTLRLANPHGDAVSTVNVPIDGPATSINAWSDYDEYGNPRQGAASSGGPAGYAWLGGHERATDESGLLLMGAMLYNPVSAQFASNDPVFGGNETAYSYPSDPVNMFDLDGRCGDWWNPFSSCGPMTIDSWSQNGMRPVIRKGTSTGSAPFKKFGWQHIIDRHVGYWKPSPFTSVEDMKRKVKATLSKGIWIPDGAIRYDKTTGDRWVEFRVIKRFRGQFGCQTRVTVIYSTRLAPDGSQIGVLTAWQNYVRET